MSKALKLTKDPIWELLRKVTIPASVGSLFQTFYSLVDTWFAGRISAEAIGAIAKSFHPEAVANLHSETLRPPPRLRPAVFVSPRAHARRVVGGNQRRVI